jgi:hypothetical protein
LISEAVKGREIQNADWEVFLEESERYREEYYQFSPKPLII